MNEKKILAFYASGNYFSGQKIAFEAALSGLQHKGWDIIVLKLPCVERNEELNLVKSIINLMRMMYLILLIWFKSLFLIPGRQAFVCIGQTPFSMLREGIPIIVSAIVNPKQKAIVATHGSNFMGWTSSCLETKLFKILINSAKFVSVLGPNQKKKLEELGIPSEKVVIVDNTSTQALLPIDIIKSKHSLANESFPSRIRVLFLSSLIEDKGYIHFLNAINLLSRDSSLSLDVLLCGKLTKTPEQNSRFKTIDEARTWIINMVSEINSSKSIHIEWIDGIQGADKHDVYHYSHIFVLPTQYRTEAQPLVLLEALASGCAIITTQAGEISSTLSKETAFFLSEVTPIAIAETISDLAQNHHLRLRLAIEGHNLFQKRFSYEKHIDNWEELLNKSKIHS